MSQVYDFEKQTSFLEDKPFLPTVFLDDAHQGKDTPYFQLTLLVIGSSGVGKTSLITSIVRPPHAILIPMEVNSQQGIHIFKRTFYYNNIPIMIHFWDLPGSLENQELISRLCQGRATGVILVYDVTQAHSFEELNKWVELFDFFHNDEAKLRVPGVVIGNKLDLTNFTNIKSPDEILNYSKVHQSFQNTNEKFVVSIQTSIEWAQKIHMEAFYTSAVTFQNLVTPLNHLVKKIIERFEALDNVTAESFFRYRMYPIRRLVPRLEIRYKNLMEKDMKIVDEHVIQKNKNR
ncbi:Ras- protein Rab-12 [Coelomomyces lativittatus]|nr:Ras- protein Rab-12 [Coelomomyces lativittatus]